MDNLDKEVQEALKQAAEGVNPPPEMGERIHDELSSRRPEFRKRIAILFGGCSPEYSVSLQSAYAVITHIDRKKYEPVLIGISNAGDWFKYDGEIEKIPADTWHNEKDCTPVVVSPGRTVQGLLTIKRGKVNEIPIDAAFPVLHGKNGEDGTVQGLFELAGIPVAGCGVLSSALCMDKDKAHKLVQSAGISVPESFVLHTDMGTEPAFRQAEQIGYPLFVKPIGAGSSYGITRVTERSQLPAAIKLAFSYDDKVIVEECISGFEVGCAVLEGDGLMIGEVDEIELQKGFFDFTEKYTLKTSSIHVPTRISREKAAEIKRTAKTIYQTLDCSGFARVDMFLDDSGRIVFNEVNTIPGFTTHSRFPNMLKAAHVPFEQIISIAIDRAVRRGKGDKT
ncbi:MAG TPA: D-alanine--D-serine ligase VanG [Candidatus Eisenbergiella merdavium]|uniref:D-alanine--D-alanine ligase n=1 Tax=Candidatus Eisenbergiella merdavium TaxID=2838551 RepID=A0A9D2SQG6_9FIRM|nr:D-alanine--D-serine ligase VanG [Candidatus Eisenbergiella merdavium]